MHAKPFPFHHPKNMFLEPADPCQDSHDLNKQMWVQPINARVCIFSPFPAPARATRAYATTWFPFPAPARVHKRAYQSLNSPAGDRPPPAPAPGTVPDAGQTTSPKQDNQFFRPAKHIAGPAH